MNNNKQKSQKNSFIALIAILIWLALVFVLDQTIKPSDSLGMLLIVLQKGSVYALAAVSMNLLNGFTGLFSLGHAGFMLIGAYTYAIFTIPDSARDTVYQYYDAAVRFSIPEKLANVMGPFGTVLGVTIAVILAGTVAAVFAYLIGLPVLRLKSDYLAIATLGFAEIIRAVFQWETLGPITNGANILSGFTDLNHIYLPFTKILIPPTFFVMLLSGLCIAVILLLINSSFGRAFKAIRDDEIAAEAMGINLFKHKEMSFVISSFFAGISGALLAMYQFTVKAATFKTAMTYEILLIVVIGGIGSISGSCIGSFLFIACNEWWLRFLDESSNNIAGLNIFRSGFRKVVFSVIIMVIVLFFRKGIMGDKELTVKNVRQLFAGRKKAKKVSEGGESHE